MSYLCAALGSDAGRAGRACALYLTVCQMAACYCSTGRSGQRELSVPSPLFLSFFPPSLSRCCFPPAPWISLRFSTPSGGEKKNVFNPDSLLHTKLKKKERTRFSGTCGEATPRRKIPFSRASFFFLLLLRSCKNARYVKTPPKIRPTHLLSSVWIQLTLAISILFLFFFFFF